MQNFNCAGFWRACRCFLLSVFESLKLHRVIQGAIYVSGTCTKCQADLHSITNMTTESKAHAKCTRPNSFAAQKGNSEY